MKPRVAILVPATQRYTALVPPLLASFEQHFLRDCEVEPIVLTDLPAGVPARTLYIQHHPWPGVAMRKYHYFCQYRQELSAFDYLFMCDADMRVVAPVGQEILGDLVATQHSGQYDKPPAEFPYERNPDSTAYIAVGEGKVYAQTAFFGGKTETMLAMAEDRSAAIDADNEKRIVAVWHDESHFNRYIYDHPPEIVLSPSYCYPEGSNYPFEPKILALDKDHDVIRSTGLKTWMIRGERLARRVLSKAKSMVARS